MQRRIFATLAIMCLTGCPYTEGCDALVDAPANGPTVDGDSGPVEPVDSGISPETSDDVVANDARPDGGGPKAFIDFGTDPVGGPALSTLSCPDLSMPTYPATVHVDANATGAEDGTKAAPYQSLEKAFTNAGEGGVVWVAAGTYRENLTIPDKDLVVYGGFAAGFATRTNACVTIIEAAVDTEAVLSADSTVRSFGLEGAWVRKGSRGLSVAGDPKAPGELTIARSVFTENGNNAAVGGGIALDGVNARIFRSVFRDNKASKGAGLSGGGRVTLTIDQNLFERNIGYSDHGGGIYLSAKLSKVHRNTFKSNATGVGIPAGFGGNWGGAAIVYNNSDTEPARGEFSFNVFTDNVAGIGAGIFVDEAATVTMSHDLFYRNRSYVENGFIRGGAIYADGTGFAGGGSTFIGEYLTVVNNNLDENGAARAASQAFGGNIYVEGFSKATVTNSIFWNNGDNGFYVEANNELSVSTSVGVPGCTSSNSMGFIPASATICKIGVGVFQPAAVYFGDEATNDYHEQSTAGRYSKGGWVLDALTSPAIDKADPLITVGAEPMPNGNRANLGVFARTTEASKSP